MGPAASLSEAMRHIETEGFDLAVLDIKLQDELVFPAAELLINRGVLFKFLTGYDHLYIPEPFFTIRFCEKPHTDLLVKMLFDLRINNQSSKP